jgi:hypothetical protein
VDGMAEGGGTEERLKKLMLKLYELTSVLREVKGGLLGVEDESS